MNEQKQGVSCSAKQWLSPEMKFNFFTDTTYSAASFSFISLVLSSSSAFSWELPKIFFLLDINDRKMQLIFKIWVILMQRATHPQFPSHGVDLFQPKVKSYISLVSVLPGSADNTFCKQWKQQQHGSLSSSKSVSNKKATREFWFLSGTV